MHVKRECRASAGVHRTRSTGTTSTRATSTTRCRSRSELSAPSCRSESTSNAPRAFRPRHTSAPHPRHVTSSFGTPSLAPSSTAVTTRHPPPTDSTLSTTVSTNAAGADHFLLVGVALVVVFPKPLEEVAPAYIPAPFELPCKQTVSLFPLIQLVWLCLRFGG